LSDDQLPASTGIQCRKSLPGTKLLAEKRLVRVKDRPVNEFVGNGLQEKSFSLETTIRDTSWIGKNCEGNDYSGKVSSGN